MKFILNFDVNGAQLLNIIYILLTFCRQIYIILNRLSYEF